MTTPTHEGPDLVGLLRELATYRDARRAFLIALGCDGSNRDPLSEFSEQIALAAIGGTMAESRVQKGWDLKDPEGHRVQVRYLTNPVGPEWLNGHVVDFRSGGCDRYALVLFEGFEPMALLVFDAEHMVALGAALAKRHGDKEHLLQLTRANYVTMKENPERFAAVGVTVVDLASPTG
jgi:hypothetical protein